MQGNAGATSNKLILGFVMLIIGVILVGVIAQQTNLRTDKLSVGNESHALDEDGFPLINGTTAYTITNAPTGWKSTDCPLTNFIVTNQSGQALTLTTDYTVTLSTGEYLLVNNDNTNTTYGLYGDLENSTYVSYTYCADDYLNQSWGRSVLDLVSGFFAIALLLGAIALFYSVAKDTGIL